MFLKSLENKNLLLASASPRRKQLLEDAGFTFTVLNSKKINERIPKGFSKKLVAHYLAELKAEAYLIDLNKDDILIAADTIVCFDDRILGKPADFDDAFRMLRSLSGRKHEVITGVSIVSYVKDVDFSSSTEVYFKDISDDEIKYYIENYEPYDKAGAYGIQEWIGLTCIEKIIGSYYNVMGLPIQKVYETLRDF